MERKIIVVADDFGLSEAFNYGVIKAYKEGIVSTLNLIVNTKATKHALDLVKKECKDAEIVLHINYVQGQPISRPQDIPTLVNADGEFYRSKYWLDEGHSGGKCVGNINPSIDDLYHECLAQVEYFKELTGHYPISFDAHSVATKNVEAAFIRVAKEKHLRCPYYDNNKPKLHEHPLRDEKGESILMRGTRLEDFINDSSSLLKSTYPINVLHFHPGYVDKFILDNSSLTFPRCYDLDTLCNPKLKTWLKDQKIEVINFNEAFNAN